MTMNPQTEAAVTLLRKKFHQIPDRVLARAVESNTLGKTLTEAGVSPRMQSHVMADLSQKLQMSLS